MNKEEVQVVEKCLKIWEYVAKAGVDKRQAYEDLDLAHDKFDCPACEYMRKRPRVDGLLDCDKCPVFAPLGLHCTDLSSPYYLYHEGLGKEVYKEAGSMMVRHLKSLLKKQK